MIPVTLARARTRDAIVGAFFIDLSGASGNAVILRRAEVHIVDDDNNEGNHWGYRNQNGGAGSVAGWGAAADRPARVQGEPAPQPPGPSPAARPGHAGPRRATGRTRSADRDRPVDPRRPAADRLTDGGAPGRPARGERGAGGLAAGDLGL